MDEKNLGLEEPKAANAGTTVTGRAIPFEGLRDFLENEEDGRKILQSVTDARVTKGIESWKQNNLGRVIEDEIAKRFPPETEERKKLRDLEVRQAELVRELKRRDLMSKAIEVANEKRLPLKMIERLLGDDEEGTLRNIQMFEEAFVKAVEDAVAEKFRASGREPSGSNGKIVAEKRDDFVGKLLESMGQ